MVTSEILKAAKARLTPETWVKGWGRLVAGKRECAAFAISCVTHTVWTLDSLAAVKLLNQVALGCDPDPNFGGANVPTWNDEPERTLQEVYDAFDAAIQIAEQQEAAPRPPVPEEVLC